MFFSKPKTQDHQKPVHVLSSNAIHGHLNPNSFLRLSYPNGKAIEARHRPHEGLAQD